MGQAHTPRARRPAPPPVEDPRVAELTIEVEALRSQAVDDRFEIQALREERALLAGRLDRMERLVQSWRAQMLEAIASPRVLTEYSPGVLHAVEEPRLNAAVTEESANIAARFAVDKLPSPASKLLTALSSEPMRSCDIDTLAARLGLEPKGDHFKRGMATLLKHGLVAQENKRLRVVGTFRKSS